MRYVSTFEVSNVTESILEEVFKQESIFCKDSKAGLPEANLFLSFSCNDLQKKPRKQSLRAKKFAGGKPA